MEQPPNFRVACTCLCWSFTPVVFHSHSQPSEPKRLIFDSSHNIMFRPSFCTQFRILFCEFKPIFHMLAWISGFLTLTLPRMQPLHNVLRLVSGETFVLRLELMKRDISTAFANFCDANAVPFFKIQRRTKFSADYLHFRKADLQAFGVACISNACKQMPMKQSVEETLYFLRNFQFFNSLSVSWLVCRSHFFNY